jgi:excisionase family DNA binding protein
MPEKLWTLEELASYLKVNPDIIVKLVDDGTITAYKVGGEYLRFRKDQVDMAAAEIKEHLAKEAAPEGFSQARLKVKELHRRIGKGARNSFLDGVLDFFYFYDFYILAFGLIAVLIMVIIKE